MAPTVDDLDRAIIDCLTHDGRMPSAQIARRLGGISTKTITSRIARLTAEGTVKVTAIANPQALGYRIIAGVEVQTAPGEVEKVGQALAEIAQVNYVALVAGDCDLWLQVRAADMEDLQVLLAETLGSVPGVERSQLAFLITHELKNEVATPTSTQQRSSGGEADKAPPIAAHATIDEVDRAIVDQLMDDGRMPATQIAYSLGAISAKTVSRRINRLLEKGIISVKGVANHRALGYSIIADIGIETEPGRAEGVGRAVAEIDQVNYVALVAGDRDLWIQVRAIDVEDLQRFILKKLHVIPGIRRTRTTLLFTSGLKDIDSWRIPADLPQGRMAGR
jgi:Lrp/AsnC family transcriptional regulator for asnA, asnC and gidA